MHGLINDAIEEMVKAKFGGDAWTAIATAAEVSCSKQIADNKEKGLSVEYSEFKYEGFNPMKKYDDAVTLGLVVAAAELLKVSVG